MAIVQCRTSFHLHGRPTIVRAGSLWDSSDPVVVGREHLFRAVEELVENPVIEQATASPGERRSIPTRKAPARKPAAED